MLPIRLRPLPADEAAKMFQRHGTEIPDAHSTTTPTERATAAAVAYPGCWVVLKENCHPSLADYYRRTLPDESPEYPLQVRAADGCVFMRYGNTPDPANPPPADPLFRTPPEDRRRSTAIPPERPYSPDHIHVHVRRDVRVKPLQRYLPGSELLADVNVGPQARYVVLSSAQAASLSETARLYLLRNVSLFVLHDSPTSAAVCAVRDLQRNVLPPVPPFLAELPDTPATHAPALSTSTP